jgi:hypothetical protein
MTREKCLEKFGTKKVYEVIGILHNYIKGDGDFQDHRVFDGILKPYHSKTVAESISEIDPYLEFEKHD